jgi:arylsulfatase A-like enzyme
MNMKRTVLLIVILVVGLAASLAAAAEPTPKPRLVLVIVIDQFRYDYTTRFAGEYKGGLARVLAQGAVFTNTRRGADLNIVLDPYWMFASRGTTHGSVFGYDTHVPVIFMGPGIRAGRYDEPIVVNDIAPTLATLLRIETPSGSVGRALNEMFSGN